MNWLRFRPRAFEIASICSTVFSESARLITFFSNIVSSQLMKLLIHYKRLSMHACAQLGYNIVFRQFTIKECRYSVGILFFLREWSPQWRQAIKTMEAKSNFRRFEKEEEKADLSFFSEEIWIFGRNRVSIREHRFFFS